MRAPRKRTRLLTELTPRERQVAVRMGMHQTQKEIAAAMGIRLGTVKNTAHHGCQRLGLPHGFSLGRYAFEQGWCVVDAKGRG